MDDIKICCPKCSWEPDGYPYWKCSCGHSWNTFATGGRCPECRKIWEDTQCVKNAGGCTAWSPHLDWYDGLEGIVEKFKEEMKESWVLMSDAFI